MSLELPIIGSSSTDPEDQNTSDLAASQLVNGRKMEVVSFIRRPGGKGLGFSIVGSTEGDSQCFIVKRVYRDGLVSMDGRIKEGKINYLHAVNYYHNIYADF